jgi:transcriptional regulator with GAF, ATPase, and Fis domain
MATDTVLWREASLATDVHAFLARVGGSVLEMLDANAIVVRLLVTDSRHVDTVAAMRKGAVGVGHPTKPRTTLTAAAAARAATWIEAGEPARASAAAAVKDLLRGVAGPDEDGPGTAKQDWWGVPVARPGVLGVLLVRANHKLEPRRVAAVGASIAAVLAAEVSRRELEQLREAAEADKDAALAKLQVRDIGLAVVGADTGLRGVMEQVVQVAPTDTPVLILGETGSGKEVLARAIHERSRRARGPVLRVNCGAIPPELVDSELFGHERGSFTGASTQHRGWFERADGGTMFLDEIGELPLAAQVRLLRVLQDGVFERVGGTRPLAVDVRIIAATHRDLAAMVRAGQFREDLWYRIHVFAIRLPPLRERTGDIAALATHFTERVARRLGVGALRLTRADVTALEGYDWPGNVRELSAVIERAAILGGGKRLDVARALGVEPRSVPDRDDAAPFATLEEAMRQHIQRALAHCKGRIEGAGGAAHLLAVHANTLRSRMQKLGIRWEQFR